MQKSNIADGKNTVQCQECKNDIELTKDSYTVGETMECPYCGTTYEVTNVDEDKTITVDEVEEEK